MSFKERKDAKTTVKISETFSPQIYIDPNALNKMFHYVNECSDEIGWLGTVEMMEDNLFHVTDVFLFEQEVHATTTEITPEGLTKFAEELLQQPDGMEIWNNIKLWGHSHVNMGVSPSGQDHTQMNAFQEGGHDWFIRLIANKKGEMKLDIYNYAQGLEYHDVPWFRLPYQEESDIQKQINALQEQLDQLAKTCKTAYEEDIKEQIKEKITKKPTFTHVNYKVKTGKQLQYSPWWQQQEEEDFFLTDAEVTREISRSELYEIADLKQSETYTYLLDLGYGAHGLTHADALRVYRVAKSVASQETNLDYTKQGGWYDADTI